MLLLDVELVWIGWTCFLDITRSYKVNHFIKINFCRINVLVFLIYDKFLLFEQLVRNHVEYNFVFLKYVQFYVFYVSSIHFVCIWQSYILTLKQRVSTSNIINQMEKKNSIVQTEYEILYGMSFQWFLFNINSH